MTNKVIKPLDNFGLFELTYSLGRLTKQTPLVRESKELKTHKEIQEHRQAILASFPLDVPIDIRVAETIKESTCPTEIKPTAIGSYVECFGKSGLHGSYMEIPETEVATAFDRVQSYATLLNVPVKQYEVSKSAVHARIVDQLADSITDKNSGWVLERKIIKAK